MVLPAPLKPNSTLHLLDFSQDSFSFNALDAWFPKIYEPSNKDRHTSLFQHLSLLHYQEIALTVVYKEVFGSPAFDLLHTADLIFRKLSPALLKKEINMHFIV